MDRQLDPHHLSDRLEERAGCVDQVARRQHVRPSLAPQADGFDPAAGHVHAFYLRLQEPDPAGSCAFQQVHP